MQNGFQMAYVLLYSTSFVTLWEGLKGAPAGIERATLFPASMPPSVDLAEHVSYRLTPVVVLGVFFSVRSLSVMAWTSKALGKVFWSLYSIPLCQS